MSLPIAHFDALYAGRADPYDFHTSPYEQARFRRTAAMLGRARFRSALELGCAEGAFTAVLAGRADAVVAVDGSAVALARAESALRWADNVRLRQAVLPDDWPDGRYDLVVLTEVGYYLSQADLSRVVDNAVADLDPGGRLVAGHWRHPGDVFRQDGDAVHALIDRHPALLPTGSDVDADVRIESWRLR